MLDGGTITLKMEDEEKKEHTVILSQYMYKEIDVYGDEFFYVPGGLYFNDELLELRSEEEKKAYSSSKENLKEPADKEKKDIPPDTLILSEDIKRVFQSSPEENEQAWLKEIIDFVSSDEYLEVAETAKITIHENED